MTLVSPGWLVLALLALPIIYAFLRRPPPQPVVVASLMLFRALGTAPARRSRPPRRELLALALMLGALVAVVTALAGRSSPAPRGLIVVLDNSASMNATVHGQRRFDLALQALEDALAVRPEANVTLITTVPAQVVVDQGSSHSAVKAAARARVVAGEDEDLGLLLTSACTGDRPPELVVLGDTPIPSELNCPVLQPMLAPPMRNRGISELRLRAVDGLGLVEAWVVVHSTEAGPVDVSLAVGDNSLGEVTLDVDGAAEARFRIMARAGRPVTARIDGSDDWAEDDMAQATVPPASRVQAHLITDQPHGYMWAALDAHPLVDLTVGGPSEATATPVDLLVIEASPAFDLPDRSHTVVLGVDAAPAPLGEVIAEPQTAQWSEADPILRHVNLESLHIRQARSVPVPASGTVMGWTSAGPVMVRSTGSDGGEWVVTGFAVADTDLGLRVGMANWVANLVLWARSDESSPGGVPDGVLSAAQTTAQPLEPVEAAAPDSGPGPVSWAMGIAGLFLLIELFIPVMSGREP